MERRLDRLEDSGKKNEDDIAKLEKKTERMEEKLESKASNNEEAMFEELREREAKRQNVIMHGVQRAT